jgi:hypothetical protein
MAPQQADPKYMLEFPCKVALTAQKDGLGQRDFQLWRVWNKYTSRLDQRIYYELQFWEERDTGSPDVQMVFDAEARQRYGEQITRWETRYGHVWKAEHKDGNPWDPSLKRTFDYSPKKPVQQSKRVRVYGKATDPSDQIESDPIRGSSPAADEKSLDSSNKKPNAPSSIPSVQFAPQPVFRIPGQNQSLKAPSQSSMGPPAQPASTTLPQPKLTSMAPPAKPASTTLPQGKLTSMAPPARPAPKAPQATPTSMAPPAQPTSRAAPSASMAPPPMKPLPVPRRFQGRAGRQLTGQVPGGQNVSSTIPSRYPMSNSSRYSTSAGPVQFSSRNRLQGSANVPPTGLNAVTDQQNSSLTHSAAGTMRSSQPRVHSSQLPLPRGGGKPPVQMSNQQGVRSASDTTTSVPTNRGQVAPPDTGTMLLSSNAASIRPLPANISGPVPSSIGTAATGSRSASRGEPSTTDVQGMTAPISSSQTTSPSHAALTDEQVQAAAASDLTIQPTHSKKQIDNSGARAARPAGHGASRIPLVANSSARKVTTGDPDTPIRQPQTANAAAKRVAETANDDGESIGPIRASVEDEDASDDASDEVDDHQSQIDELRSIRAESVSYFASQSEQGIADEFEKTTGQVLNGVFLQTLDESQEDAADSDDDDTASTQVAPAPGVVDDTLNRYAKLLIAAHEDSLSTLVRTTLDLKGMPDDKWAERRKSSSIDVADFESSIRSMLASFDTKVLKHLVMGDLPRASRVDRELTQTLRKLTYLGKDVRCPCIYIQYLVDSQGFSPTPKTLFEILDAVEKYTVGFEDPNNTESSEFAKKIEGRTMQTVFGIRGRPAGDRKYVKSKIHKANITVWLAATRARLNGCPADEPLARPLCEVGYATKPGERLEQHSKHSSSNYIMNLTEAVCKTMFKQYSMAQFVLFHLFHPVHAMIGEIICTRLSLGYISHGGGFSHHPAGESVAGASGMPVTYYRDRRNVVFSNPMYQDNMRKDTRAIREKTETLLQLSGEAIAHIEEMKDMNTRIPDMLKSVEEETAEAEELATTSVEITDPFTIILDWAKSLDTDAVTPDSHMSNT